MKFSRIKLVERKFVKIPAKFGEVKESRTESIESQQSEGEQSKVTHSETKH